VNKVCYPVHNTEKMFNIHARINLARRQPKSGI
jgi:hypothetical protein